MRGLHGAICEGTSTMDARHSALQRRLPRGKVQNCATLTVNMPMATFHGHPVLPTIQVQQSLQLARLALRQAAHTAVRGSASAADRARHGCSQANAPLRSSSSLGEQDLVMSNFGSGAAHGQERRNVHRARWGSGARPPLRSSGMTMAAARALRPLMCANACSCSLS